jgi:hypothetical protein
MTSAKTETASLAGLAGDSALNQGMQSGVSTAAWEAMSHTGSVARGIGEGAAGSALSVTMLAHRSANLTYVWAVPGSNSSNVNVPSHGTNFGISFAGISGVNADQYAPAIVKLTSTSNHWRLVGATPRQK